MNLLPSFVVWPFAVAGLIAAAGPFIIHLLNRRRFRVVQWAAMDFLREALQRNRRILQLRDLLLLLLRTAAVLLVGLGLAQPFFSSGDETFDGSKPLHAVLVMDNSLSMGYQSLEGTLLDKAKERARQFIEKLPADSRVSVIPLCGSGYGYSPDAMTKDAALESLARIEVVDRSASVLRAVNEAKKACDAGPVLGKRVVFFGDQQTLNWNDVKDAAPFADLPPFQVVDVSAPQRDNTWISDFRVQDGLADVETPTTFIVQVRHEGSGPRSDVEVRLSVDGVEVGAKTLTLEPGQGAREVAFQHLFDTYRPEPGGSLSVPVKVALTPDHLPEDDERHLVVPLVAALPVVFVDQYGAEEENPAKNRLGETRPLRKLLAPVASRVGALRQLVQIRHVKLEHVTRELLADARLVVVAGIAGPGDKVSLLREYVEQGGQLVIGTGGSYDSQRNAGFDPVRWTESAWLDGRGILPVPLLPEPLGMTLTEAGNKVTPFSLAYESLRGHQYFQLADVNDDDLRDLYLEPMYFKAVRANVGDELLRQLRDAEVARLEENYRLFAAAKAAKDRPEEEASKTKPASEALSPLDEEGPRWVLWDDPAVAANEATIPEGEEQRKRLFEERAARTLPRVLARFDDPGATAFLVTRRIGRGDVVFSSSGFLTDWTTLSTSHAVLMFDRILRSMIQSTLPQRNFATTERIALPLAAEDRDAEIALQRPGAGAAPEVLDTGFVGRQAYGFSIEQPLVRGLYRVTAYKQAAAGGSAARETAWQLPLAINGPAEESELQPLARERFEERVAKANVRWVGPEEEISLEGTQIAGQTSWWWLILAALGLLAVELVLLGRSAAQTRVTPNGFGVGAAGSLAKQAA